MSTLHPAFLTVSWTFRTMSMTWMLDIILSYNNLIESAKLHVLHAHVPTYLACLCSHVPISLACLYALVPMCPACLRAHVATSFVCLRAHMPTYLAYLFAHMPMCLACPCLHVLTCFSFLTCSPANLPCVSTCYNFK